MPLPDEEPDYGRKRSMQLILDEIHALQKEWESQGTGEWAEASIINSSKVLVVTVSQVIYGPQDLMKRRLMIGNSSCRWIGSRAITGIESSYSST